MHRKRQKPLESYIHLREYAATGLAKENLYSRWVTACLIETGLRQRIMVISRMVCAGESSDAWRRLRGYGSIVNTYP